ncbi:MAG: hypothetical protein ACOVO1_09950 [Chitinophagaceae bacterium]
MSIIGIPIGFYGYLFPGNINLMILELYINKQFNKLLIVMGLVLLFESLYCFFTLHFLYKTNINRTIFHNLEISAYLLTLAMGLWMLFEKAKPKSSTSSNIYRGIFSAVIHPQQIPFWLFIGVLFNGVINLSSSIASLVYFVLFNAIGTFLILMFYAYFGNKIIVTLNLRMNQINKVVGVVYIIIAILSLLK